MTDISEIVKKLSGLTHEQREKLLDMGVVTPQFSGESVAIKWVYRCPHCGGAALEFIGDFEDEYGNKTPPPISKQIGSIPWVQRAIHPSQVNRAHPNCQLCNVPIPIEETAGGNFFRSEGHGSTGYIVEAEPYMMTRSGLTHEMERRRRDFLAFARKNQISLEGGRAVGNASDIKKSLASSVQSKPGFDEAVGKVVEGGDAS